MRKNGGFVLFCVASQERNCWRNCSYLERNELSDGTQWPLEWITIAGLWKNCSANSSETSFLTTWSSLPTICSVGMAIFFSRRQSSNNVACFDVRLLKDAINIANLKSYLNSVAERKNGSEEKWKFQKKRKTDNKWRRRAKRFNKTYREVAWAHRSVRPWSRLD